MLSCCARIASCSRLAQTVPLAATLATVTIHMAKTYLSQLLARGEHGEEIVLARGKHPVARPVPFHPPVAKRQFGALRGIVSVGPGFFELLAEVTQRSVLPIDLQQPSDLPYRIPH
jgi:antitoxin (DNA-binding transcriptional repressor) of toxin-antitoxin stability system